MRVPHVAVRDFILPHDAVFIQMPLILRNMAMCSSWWRLAAITFHISLALARPVWAAPTALPVVATFSILGEVVAQVGGETIKLDTFVSPDSDAHTFEPSPRDNVTLSRAKLVFEIGLAFETWLDKLYDASGSRAQRVVVSTGLPLLTDDHDSAPQREHGEFDPHIWHDVQSLIHITQRVREALIDAAPDQASIYRANAARYIEVLQALDAWVVTQVQRLPAPHRKLVTSHNTFRYFAKRYGFTIVSTPLGASTDMADPSAGAMAALIDRIQAEAVPAIFAENVHNPKLVQRIAHEAGVKRPPPLYTDALGAPGSSGETLFKMIRHNVTTIVEALQSR